MDKSILVSGGSRGLGLAFCSHYLEKGYKVFTFARKATSELKAVQTQFPQTFHFAEFDLLAFDQLDGFVHDVVKVLGKIDVLVNNAAIGQDHFLAHFADELVLNILNINVTGTILLTKRVIKEMLFEEKGSVVNVSSICADKGYPGLSVYSATKGALNAFTRSLAKELGARNIYINAIAPGFFSSEMSEVLTDRQMDVIRRRTPTERFVESSDIVKACDVFVEDDLNITGQVLSVDGGAGIG